MLCERGGLYDVVKVLDFGLVKEIASEDDAGLTAADHVVGTPLYMAPETVTALDTVDPRSDVYAVGAIAYALVTGQHVFTGKSGVEIIGHHLHSAPVPPSERLGRSVDPFLERLILTCLAKRPEDRPADAGALLGASRRAGRAHPGRSGTRASGGRRAPSRCWKRGAPRNESVSRAPKLAVDVSSRMRKASSIPELSLDEDLQTAVSPGPATRPEP